MEREWPLVGRAAELARVDELLLTGAGAVVLAGPAGVGKTRLATECLGLAEQRGFAPVRVAATRAASGLPFGAYASLLPDLAPGADRTEMLRQIANAVVARGEAKPVALLVDDAHLLDESSAALTHHLAASSETFVLATLRSGEPASDAVMALWKDGLAERLDVSPLSLAEVGALLAAVLGGPAEGAAVRLLWDRSVGNALFLKELVLAATHAGVLRDDGGLWSLQGKLPASDRLVELVEARLAGLRDDERAVLELIAMGEPLGIDGIEGLGGQTDLEALERRALVRIEESARRLQVRLAHPLYGEVVRARLSPFRVRALSRSLADVVEGTGARRREDVLRVATWRLESGGETRPDTMLAAGRQARALFQFDLADRLVRTAIDAGAGFEAELFLAEMLFLQGRYDDAEDVLGALGRRAGDDRGRVRVADLRIDILALAGRIEEAMVVLLEAEAAVTDPAWRDDFTVKRATLAFFQGFTAVVVGLLEPLLDRLSGQALIEACSIAEYAFALSGRSGAVVAARERGLAAHRDLGAAHQVWYPAMLAGILVRALTWTGCLSEAAILGTRSYEDQLAEGNSELQSWFAFYLADCYRSQGRAETAVRWAREAVGVVRPLGRHSYFRNLLMVLAGALVLAGRVDEAETVLAEIDALPVTMVRWEEAELLRIRAWVGVARGDLATARGLLEEAAATAVSSGDLVYESAALHDLARLGHAPEVIGRLRELAGMIEGPLAPARAGHAEALARREAPGLEDASAAFEGLGALLLAAEAAADAAVAWRKAGDPRKAASAERRAHVLAARCEGARTPALAAVTARASLSARELEIGRLAAAGVSNKEIAARLFLSVRTVENKLHAAYEKLGVEGRAGLAEALEAF